MSETNKITINIGRIRKTLDNQEHEPQKIKLILRPSSASGSKRPTPGDEQSGIKSPIRNLIAPHTDAKPENQKSDDPESPIDGFEQDDDSAGQNERVVEADSRNSKVNMDFLRSANRLYSSSSLFEGTPFSPISPSSNPNWKRKGFPIRALPHAKSFQERVRHQILKLEFIDTNSERSETSSQDSYLKSLVTFYRSKHDIHRLRMKRRHERIYHKEESIKHAEELRAVKRSLRSLINEDDADEFNDDIKSAEPLRKVAKVKGRRGRPRLNAQTNSSPNPISVDTDISPIESKEQNASPRSRQPLDIYNHPLSDQLDDEEKEVCVNARVLPDQYLHAKEQLISAYQKHGFFHKTAARKFVKGIDVNRLGKLWEYFVSKNILKQND